MYRNSKNLYHVLLLMLIFASGTIFGSIVTTYEHTLVQDGKLIKGEINQCKNINNE